MSKARPKSDNDISHDYAEQRDKRSDAYIELKNETDDLQAVVITVSNWRYTWNWTVQNGDPLKQSNLPTAGFGVAAFNPSHPRRRAIGGDSFQLAIPFEVMVTGSAGAYKLEINSLE